MFRKRQIGRWFCLLLCLPALTASPAAAQSKEYQIKAAFLLNFTQFVQWPAAAFAGAAAPLCIGVLGDDPFGAALEETVRGESIQDHKLTVRRAQKLEDLADCQLVFVSKSENGRVPEILAKIDSHPVVTVSEVAGFAKQGGTINFYREQNKVRFEINPAAARQSGLKISSQLLALGKIVESTAPTK
jgi:hypothetical protein